MNDFEMIDDAALDNVTGGLSLSFGSLSVDATLGDGLSVESDLGSLSVESPITIAENVFSTATGAISDLLSGFGTALTDLGNLFKFS
jgi:hypothetical protein